MGGIGCAMIADDITGACDTGLQLVRGGLRARVLSSPAGVSGDAEVLVWNTETRNAPPSPARQAVARAWDGLRGCGPRVWYKKIDSTLRGPWPFELAELMRLGAFRLALVAPALPEAGRVTVGGWHLVHGVPVARTEMGTDAGAAVRQSYLPRFLEGIGLPVVLVGLDVIERGPSALGDALAGVTGIAVLDAAAPEDLRSVAQAAAALDPAPLLCGSAGLAAHLPGAFGMRPAGPLPVPEPAEGAVLMVAGSRHSVTRRQLEVLQSVTGIRQAGSPAEARTRWGQGEDLVLTVASVGSRDDSAAAPARLGALAAIVQELVESRRPAGLVLTGGSTALEVARALGASGFEILSAVGGQVPLCRLGDGPRQGLPVVTKGGALGEEDVLVRAVAQLRSGPAGPRPRLAITLGDPSGIGPEVVVKALADPEVRRRCRPLVIGHPEVVRSALAFAPAGTVVREVSSPAGAWCEDSAIAVWSPVAVDLAQVAVGRACAESGRAAVGWVQAAVDLALAGTVDGVVTAPLNKEAMRLAGYPYAGHTELLGERTGSREYRMMLASDRLTVVHATTHVALAAVPERVTTDRVEATLRLTRQALADMGLANPRIAVAGLNPHAGESGLFGDEEQRVIGPAVARARQQGMDASGPWPPDTVFRRACQGEFDAVVAMYHDQGHIPAKLVAFAEGVNVTLGLPIVRTSVDHGTAFDLAGRGVADHRNMVQAIRMGARLALGRADRPA